MKLVANMMMYNDVELLPEVIPQLHAFCDYLVIQDNGSTDGSYQIAKRLSAKGDIVYQYPQSNPPNAAESRNKMLQMTKEGEWVLKWDTDELPSDDMVNNLCKFIEDHPEINGYSVPCYHIMKQPRLVLPMEMGYGHLCLFRKFNDTFWRNPVHQEIVTKGPHASIHPESGMVILHFSYFMEERLKKKAAYYASRPDSGFTDARQLTDRLNLQPQQLPRHIKYHADDEWLETIRRTP